MLCNSAGDRLAREFVTGDAVRSGETIAVRADGSKLTAPSDGFVVFPNRNASPMEELYYFGSAQQTVRLGAHAATFASPFQSKLMPWPGRSGASALPSSSTSGCSM